MGTVDGQVLNAYKEKFIRERVQNSRPVGLKVMPSDERHQQQSATPRPGWEFTLD